VLESSAHSRRSYHGSDRSGLATPKTSQGTASSKMGVPGMTASATRWAASFLLRMMSIVPLDQRTRARSTGWVVIESTPAVRTDAAPPPSRHSIGLGQGVALYVCAILGAGVLVFPGQVASL